MDLLSWQRSVGSTTLLGFGAGDGHMAGLLERIGYRVTSMDIARTIAARTRAFAPSAQILVADAAQLPFEAGSFPVIYCNSVLQYVHRAGSLAEVHRVLRAGGSFIAVENLHGSPVARLVRAYIQLTGRKYLRHQTPRHHLRRNELPIYNRIFQSVDYSFHNLTTAWAVGLSLLPDAVKRAATPTLRPLHAIDRALLRAMPALEDYAWHVLIHART